MDMELFFVRIKRVNRLRALALDENKTALEVLEEAERILKESIDDMKRGR